MTRERLPVPGRPTIWITVGQGPTALTVGAGGVGLDIFTLPSTRHLRAEKLTDFSM